MSGVEPCLCSSTPVSVLILRAGGVALRYTHPQKWRPLVLHRYPSHLKSPVPEDRQEVSSESPSLVLVPSRMQLPITNVQSPKRLTFPMLPESHSSPG